MSLAWWAVKLKNTWNYDERNTNPKLVIPDNVSTNNTIQCNITTMVRRLTVYETGE